MDRLWLVAHLERALSLAPAGALLVGFSGGVDSTALLHALSMLPAARTRGLRALHVDHGLHAESARWAVKCRAFGESLGVAVEDVRVEVVATPELGLEGAARQARHGAFATRLREGELLVLAHHRDDQAETVLLRLMHSAGVEGLAAMRTLRTFGPGWLWRPLLEVGRDVLVAHARQHDLTWIEDPANASPHHARNHVRHAVLPALTQRWPDAARRLAAAAQRLRGEAQALEEIAGQVLQATLREHAFARAGTLDIEALRQLSPAIRRVALARWLDTRGLPRPPPGVWTQLGTLLDARTDAGPMLAWRGAQLRRYRNDLFAMSPLAQPAVDWCVAWDGIAPLALPTGFGTLRLGTPAALLVRARQGGERIAQAGAHRELRTLLQDLGVPPWIRARLPLVFDAEGTLLAAGDLACVPGFMSALRWQRDGD